MDSQLIERIRDGIAYESARSGPPEGFPQLPDIPGGRYTDPEFLALENEHLWKRSWLYAAHTDELPEPGSYMLWNKTGSPILIVRGNDRQIRAFYNTCRHRGAPLVRDKAGQTRGLACAYHGWTYDLEGHLVNLRDKRDFVGLDMSCRSLLTVRCETIGNWIFINEDPNAEPLLDHLGPIPSHWQQYQIERIRFVEKHGFDIECNVKVLMDAFLEVYHLKSIHQHTVDRFLDHRGSTMLLWRRGHSLMFTPNRRADWVDPGTVGMKKIDTVDPLWANNNPSYNVYPNLVTPFADSGMPFILFWPTGPRTMRVECHWFAPDWGDGPVPERWETRIANFDRILEEDTQFAPQIQQSVESPGFRGMPLNYQERRIYHWHEELDRRIGTERIRPDLRVRPMLEPYLEN
jgi:phenylpropionate dioxygenase-like ring-hydroxylating dioxygenase large terminal subunit